MLSFTLSGKHITYTKTYALILDHNKHITVTDLRIFRNSYNKFTYLIILVTNLCFFGYLVYDPELILITNLCLLRSYTYDRLILISISRRSLQNLCLYISTLRYYKAYTYYGVFTCSEVPVGTTEILRNVYWYYGTYRYTEVPVSTTKLILVLRILYLYSEAYPGLIELILVLLNLFLYFRSYTCIT